MQFTFDELTVFNNTEDTLELSCKKSTQFTFDESTVFNDSEDGPRWQVWRKALAVCFSNDNIKTALPYNRQDTDIRKRVCACARH
jgi:hypothetical protein